MPSAISHHATQGDGNHFAFVGRLRSTGETCLVTHHGSRKPGALLYKAGLKAAIAHTSKISPDTLKQNSWIDAESGEGEEYWNALQIMREWTKSNHQAIHRLASHKVQAITVDQFWNEHNFVFQRDGWFYHAKGATPGWKDFADDSTDRTLVPLNMAEPVLITEGRDAPGSLGFLPHGAGRNMSRTQFEKANAHRTVEGQIEEETAGIDARFWIGKPDRSELPSAYKNADSVEKQIRQYRLARVVDYVDPYGSIMAGDCHRPRKKKVKK
jgi:RNA-splicing ligase RtcB